MAFGIIIKNYEHFNRSLPNWDSPKGKYIGSKAQYERELKKNGFIPYEKAQALSSSANTHKPYDGLSPKAMKFLHQVKDMADKKGNIKVSDRFVKGLKEHGVKVDCQWDKLPKSYQSGGFDGQGV